MSAKAVPEGKFADIGDKLQIHYHEMGAGFPVLFLHGSGPGASGWSNFRRNYPYFANNGFRAIVPDTIGFGYSSKPDNVDYTLDFVVGALERFTKSVGIDECAIVGNSHGGALAIKYALNHPKKVKQLILMAPGGLEEREAYMKMEGIRAMMKIVLNEGISREGMRKIFSLQLFDPSQLTEEIIDERLQIAELQPKRVLATLQVPHLAPELSKLECPVFGLWGMNDKFCPVTGAQKIAESCARSNSQVLLLPNCGHWIMVERPELFNRMCIDFLKGAEAK